MKKCNILFFGPAMVGIICLIVLLIFAVNQYIIQQEETVRAIRARDIAYKTRKSEDVLKANYLIKSVKLNAKKKKELIESMDKLIFDLSQISKIRKILEETSDNFDESTFKQLKEEINTLKDTYTREDKMNFLKILKKKEEEIYVENRKYVNKKLIALTFDDGPNPNTTPQLLKVLQDEKVQVTFFALGQQAQSYPEIIKQESIQGHEVASHTWDHKDLTALLPSDQKQEILSAHDFINKITGKPIKLFRPPYGSCTDSILNLVNLEAVNWTVDTNDWRYSTSDPVVQNAVNYAHDGAIILMHDIHPWSVAAVPRIIQSLKKEGYCFVTVSNLLKLREKGEQDHQIYFGK